MNTRQKFVAIIGCCLIGMSPFVVAVAEQHEEDDAERCLSLRRIARTEVVDDYNILFYMRGGQIYRNQLPHRCPGLRSQRTFMYRTSLSQLCDLDLITVLYNAGSGFTPGPSCGLGRFYPISKEEAKALKEAPPRIRGEEEVAPAEPEEIGDTD